jgi:hypothetical protein
MNKTQPFNLIEEIAKALQEHQFNLDKCKKKLVEISNRYADLQAYELLSTFTGHSYDVDNKVFNALTELHAKLGL